MERKGKQAVKKKPAVKVAASAPVVSRDRTVKATCPDGAIVGYDGEGTPASDSLFPIGQTIVTLTSGETFTVTVTP